MLLTMLLAAVAWSPAASLPLRPMEAPLSTKARDCPNARTYQAEDGSARLRPRRLDELPPGRLELTVLREFDGCPIPAVVREGLGAAGDPDGRQSNRR